MFRPPTYDELQNESYEPEEFGLISFAAPALLLGSLVVGFLRGFDTGLFPWIFPWCVILTLLVFLVPVGMAGIEPVEEQDCPTCSSGVASSQGSAPSESDTVGCARCGGFSRRVAPATASTLRTPPLAPEPVDVFRS